LSNFARTLGKDVAKAGASGEERLPYARINGHVFQRDLSHPAQRIGFEWTESNAGASSREATFRRLLAEALREHGLVDLVDMHIGLCKSLYCVQGDGLQCPHFDSPHQRDRSRYSVILYLTDHHRSTAVPTFSADQLAPHDEDTHAALERQRRCAHLFNSEYYESHKVKAGDIMVMRHGTPHFGTRNDLAAPRCVLFCLLAPEAFSAAKPQRYDANQWFPVRAAARVEADAIRALALTCDSLTCPPVELCRPGLWSRIG
jgi:hypothetical protein